MYKLGVHFGQFKEVIGRIFHKKTFGHPACIQRNKIREKELISYVTLNSFQI
jgi:hypothetical protein